MNPVEFLIYAASVDLLMTFRIAFVSRPTVQAILSIVETGSRALCERCGGQWKACKACGGKK